MLRPDPRIPEAVRRAQLTGLRLVTVEMANGAFALWVATLDQPLRPPVPVIYLPPAQKPAPPIRTHRTRRDSAKEWATEKGLSGEKLEDFLTVVFKGKYCYRDALAIVMRPKASA